MSSMRDGHPFKAKYEGWGKGFISERSMTSFHEDKLRRRKNRAKSVCRKYKKI